MNQVKCINCGFTCQKYGKTKASAQRWYCKQCKCTFTNPIDNSVKHFNQFMQWLFSKKVQRDMPGNGRTFRRNTAKFWSLWPMPPIIESQRTVLFVDGIYLSRKACVLICCDEQFVLGWYVCRYERAEAWEALLQRIAPPLMVVSDGGPGFRKAMKKVWPTARLQRCIFHAFCQVKRYTTSRPKTLAGMELYNLAKKLLDISSEDQAVTWIETLT